MLSSCRGQAQLTHRHSQTACTVQLAKRPGCHHGRPAGPDVQLHSHSDNVAASAGKWNQLTERLVGYSAIPFSILVLPQVIQNARNMSAGNAAALSIISWEGYLSALMGNTLMCSHFANRGERSAVNVQLVGILNNMLVLLQVALAKFMPAEIFIAVTCVLLVAVAMSLARLSGTFSKTPGQQDQQQQQEASSAVNAQAQAGQSPNTGSWDLWRAWQLVSGVAGLAIVPQVLYNIMVPGNTTLMPGLTALVLLSGYFFLKLRGGADGAQVEQLPGVASTLLFALSPLPQLVRNFLEPQSLEGLSLGTMLLALLGNALMVPRALLVKDSVWLAGTSWACAAGWGQLLSMAIRTAPATGAQYLSPLAFAGLSIALWGYLAWVAVTTSQHRGPAAAAA